MIALSGRLSRMDQAGMPSHRLYQLIATSLILLGAVALQAFAFTEPNSAPPAGNVYAPLNTGPTSQDKSGSGSAWITSDSLGSRYMSLFATLGGNVGIGTVNPLFKLDVQGGGLNIGDRGDGCCSQLTEIDGKGQTHFYTFANGNFQIQKYGPGSPGGAVLTISNGGNVGIGTTNPASQLQINGGLTFGGGNCHPSWQNNALNIDFCPGTGARIQAFGGNLGLNPAGGNVGVGTNNPAGTVDVEDQSNTATFCLNHTCTVAGLTLTTIAQKIGLSSFWPDVIVCYQGNTYAEWMINGASADGSSVSYTNPYYNGNPLNTMTMWFDASGNYTTSTMDGNGNPSGWPGDCKNGIGWLRAVHRTASMMMLGQ